VAAPKPLLLADQIALAEAALAKAEAAGDAVEYSRCECRLAALQEAHMTRAQEIADANAQLVKEQLKFPVGSLQRAQLQARIDANNFELTRGN
jgi:hypothetical protein